MLTAEQLQKIEQDAKQATPGPWKVDPSEVNALGHVGTATDDVCQARARSGDYDHYQRRSNARHIANCDPQTVLELVRMARRYAYWHGWWVNSPDVVSQQLPERVEAMLDDMDLDDAFDAAIAGERG